MEQNKSIKNSYSYIFTDKMGKHYTKEHVKDIEITNRDVIEFHERLFNTVNKRIESNRIEL